MLNIFNQSILLSLIFVSLTILGTYNLKNSGNFRDREVYTQVTKHFFGIYAPIVIYNILSVERITQFLYLFYVFHHIFILKMLFIQFSTKVCFSTFTKETILFFDFFEKNQGFLNFSFVFQRKFKEKIYSILR